MARFYCPGCFKDFPEDHDRCPACGLDIHAFYDPKDYVDKLIMALKHPESSTPVRAAWLLGRIGDERAVRKLIECFIDSDDIYLYVAVARALGEIGTEEALEFLASQRDHAALMVRNEIQKALGLTGTCSDRGHNNGE